MTAAAVGAGSVGNPAKSHAPARSLPAPTPAAGVLVVVLPSLPPPLNHIYHNRAQGGRMLTAPARAWQDAMALLIGATARATGWAVGPRTELDVALDFSDPAMLRSDVDGKLKLVIDALAAGIGVDDRFVRRVTATKYRGAPSVRLTVTVWTGAPHAA
jgi:Holliday junction resolvase RusA-like endonuclease